MIKGECCAIDQVRKRFFAISSPKVQLTEKKGRRWGGNFVPGFLSYHTNHLTLTFRIKILPWISTYSWWKNFRMKRQAKEEKREINQTTNTFKRSLRARELLFDVLRNLN
jgi:hypothetical protein